MAQSVDTRADCDKPAATGDIDEEQNTKQEVKKRKAFKSFCLVDSDSEFQVHQPATDDNNRYREQNEKPGCSVNRKKGTEAKWET
jgi:hypothetical protein